MTAQPPSSDTAPPRRQLHLMSNPPLSPGGRALFSTVLIVGASIIVVATGMVPATWTFVETRVRETSTVAGAWIQPPDLRKRGKHMAVTFSYEVDGETYRQAGSVQKWHWRGLHPSEQRTPKVRYVVAAPHTATLDETGDEFLYWLLLFGLPLGLFAWAAHMWVFFNGEGDELPQGD